MNFVINSWEGHFYVQPDPHAIQQLLKHILHTQPHASCRRSERAPQTYHCSPQEASGAKTGKLWHSRPPKRYRLILEAFNDCVGKAGGEPTGTWAAAACRRRLPPPRGSSREPGGLQVTLGGGFPPRTSRSRATAPRRPPAARLTSRPASR